MIAGHAEMFDGYVSRYVPASGTPILSAGYRLAPEHPHPVPVEDAYAALAWLHEHAADLGAARPASALSATAPAAAWPPRCRSWPATATARPSPGRSSSCRCTMTAP